MQPPPEAPRQTPDQVRPERAAMPSATLQLLAKRLQPTPSDVIAGLVTGLLSIPEGMAYANISGFNPVLGLYSGMLPTLVGSVFARTVLMVTTLTSAIALSSQSVLKEAGLDPTDLHNIATLTLLVGLVMAAFGLLRLGSIMGFVSNAVMTGFTTGIALHIITGVLKDTTGYAPAGSNTLGKLFDWVIHFSQWQSAPTLVAVVTIGVWAVAHQIKRVESLATLVALMVVTVGTTLIGVSVKRVGDIASIPNGLPTPVLPDLSVVPHLLAGAVAVSLLTLAEAAGIGAAVPNPDGSRADASRDFLAQGLANLAGCWFQALPVGGSLSRTGVATSAGARTRWTGIFAGLWLALIALLFGSAAEVIPMPVIGGLIIVIGAEILLGRQADIRLVLRTAPLPSVAMVVTFLATTALPLQDAIFLGAGLSLILFCVGASQQSNLVALVSAGPDNSDRWRIVPVPESVPSNAVTVLHYAGTGLFAELPRIDDRWPRTDQTHDAVIILSIRTLPDVPSTTLLKWLEHRAKLLESQGVRLMLVGLDEETMRVFERSGVLAQIGARNVIRATDEVFGALDRAMAEAKAWSEARKNNAPMSPVSTGLTRQQPPPGSQD
jgi:SulP family sulfate permease